ncbi:histidine phosphatase family protein [Polynucleobacter paneuropaeus]|nr:histidine phosphatase family protein [Polynucleobacter paneuropaeus]
MSCVNKKISIFIISLICLLITSQAKAALADDLKDGQHVLLMRHADAPGYGDPAGYDIGLCSTQRNLGDYGKKQAKAIGSWLRGQGINKAQIFSSPWCRCSDTAQLLDLGSVKIETPLGSFFDDMSLEKKQTKELEQLIKSELDKQSKLPIILITHHVNIRAFMGKNVSQGDMVLVKVNKSGEYISHVIYPSPQP